MTSRDELRNRILGFGEKSMRKNYFGTLKQTGEELHRFRVLLNKTSEMIFVADAQTGIVTDMNDSARFCLGIDNTSEFNILNHLKEFFRDLDYPGSEGFSFLLNTKDPVFVSPKDIPFELSISFETYNERNYAVIVLKDISHRLKVENEKEQLRQQLFQSQKMEAMGQLAGGIAHDFNNILTGIIGHASLAATEINSAENLEEYINQILKDAQRAAALVNQILAFSRKQVLKTQFITVNTLVSDMIKLLDRLIGEKVQILNDLKTEDHSLNVDITLIQSVILNIVINARDAMPSGGIVAISSEYDFSSKTATILIADTGNGIPVDISSRIFEPFFTTKGASGGNGLGLATSWGIVKQHGGSLDFTSEVGKGTTFRISLPYVETEKSISAGPGNSCEIHVCHDELNILLVEDDSSVAKIIMKLLSKWGCNIFFASDPDEAIQLFRTNSVDLVISDIVMPGMTGVEMMETINTIRKVPVLFMSGYSDLEIASMLENNPECSFIAKPFTPAQFNEKMNQVLVDFQTENYGK
ncbi:response regulator [Myxococcota bacterium]|nr:response regulator [Myxococcota bacterium]MBU1379663.1 response regulator [Myxococcota bacterium]MBU1497492.1 response regulator [Myxococcota bacterium]